MGRDFELFCKKLPKLELHAHLNGSLSDDTLKELHHMQNSDHVGDVPWSRWQAVIDHGDHRTLDECFQIFEVAHSLTTTPEAVRKATRDVIRDFADDGVVYLELRSTPRDVVGIMNKSQYIQAIVKTIEECEHEHNILVKLIISVNRKHGKAVAEDILSAALEARNLFPDVIVGLDLSGNPNEGDIDDYLPLLGHARLNGLKIAVHVAEVPNINEIRKILQFRPDRLGHGTCIHPQHGGSEEIWQQLLASKIPVEVCLTSNVKTKTCASYKQHHFKPLFDAKHPISLGTDDKGVFATSLSQEYHHAAVNFSLDEQQLRDLSSSGLDFVFAAEHEKTRLKKLFFNEENDTVPAI